MLGRFTSYATCAVFALATHQAAQAQTTTHGAPQPADAAPVSDDIIVTASLREERLRDAPSSITAITGDTLVTQGVQSFRDYASLVPGLSQRDNGAPGLGTVILRGMNTGGQQTTNTTAYYVDNTVFTASGFLSLGWPHTEAGFDL